MNTIQDFASPIRAGYKGEKIFVAFDRGMRLLIFDDGQIFRWLEGTKEWEKLNITAE